MHLKIKVLYILLYSQKNLELDKNFCINCQLVNNLWTYLRLHCPDIKNVQHLDWDEHCKLSQFYNNLQEQLIQTAQEKGYNFEITQEM